MGESSSKKLLRVLLMLICCAGAGYFFWTTMQIIENNEYSLDEAARPQPPDPVAEAEKGEIGAAEEGLQNLSRSSSQAMRVALLAEVQNKYPIDLPESLVVTNTGPVTADAPVVEPDPPDVTIEAIMITDSDKVALVRVDGEEGVLLRSGSRFSENKARITNIDAKGLDFIWMRKKIRVSL
jgi:hypothetical protein